MAGSLFDDCNPVGDSAPFVMLSGKDSVLESCYGWVGEALQRDLLKVFQKE